MPGTVEASPAARGLATEEGVGEAPTEQPPSPMRSPAPTLRPGGMGRVGSASRVEAPTLSLEQRHAELISSVEGLKAEVIQVRGQHAELEAAHAELAERHERTSATLRETSRARAEEHELLRAQLLRARWTGQEHAAFSSVTVPRAFRWRFVGCIAIALATSVALSLMGIYEAFVIRNSPPTSVEMSEELWLAPKVRAPAGPGAGEPPLPWPARSSRAKSRAALPV